MTHRHEVALAWPDGRELTVRADADETVLAATEAADVALPFGCRTGACSTCVARLLDGSVAHACRPRALRPHDLAAGYVLCCIARPRADCRLAVGASVQAERLPEPWR